MVAVEALSKRAALGEQSDMAGLCLQATSSACVAGSSMWRGASGLLEMQ